MIKITFTQNKGNIAGFVLSGHAGAADAGEDVICAAVSSAAYLAANTITEIMGIPARSVAQDGYFSFEINEGGSKESAAILSGLKLHLSELQKQYPEFISVNS